MSIKQSIKLIEEGLLNNSYLVRPTVPTIVSFCVPFSAVLHGKISPFDSNPQTTAEAKKL